jgi:hypothetical protein
MESIASRRPIPGASMSWPQMLSGALLGAWTLLLARRPQPWTPLDWVNLPFHEAGHILLLPFGETLHFLGGTLFQLLIPASLILYFILRRSPFSSSLCLWWLGQNCLGISVYMADARDLRLPLVGGGENDWNFLFYQWGLLSEDSVRRVSGATHGAGVLVMMSACLWMIFLALPAAWRESLGGPLLRKVPWIRLLYLGE